MSIGTKHSDTRGLRDKVLGRYLLLTIAIFLVISLPAAYVLDRTVQNLFIEFYGSQSLKSTDTMFGQHLNSSPITEPLEGEKLSEFKHMVVDHLPAEFIRGVEVYDPNGRLMFVSGSDVGEPGDKIALGEEFDKALDGTKQSFRINGGVPGIDEPVLELMLPFTSEDEVSNVVRVHASISAISQAVDTARYALLSFMGALFVVVAIVGWVGAKQMGRRNEELERLSEKLEAMAERDGLTGIYNRRSFEDFLESEFATAVKNKQPLGIFMLDLDFFKHVNDHFGHQTGDVVLQEVAHTIQRSIRDEDILARYGGEEFIVIMPDTSPDDAMMVAERARVAIRALAIKAGDEMISVSASFGVAEYPDCADSESALVAAADASLLIAKKTGRNRVCHFRDIGGQEVAIADVDKIYHRFRYAGVLTAQALAAAVKENDGFRGIEAIHSELIGLAADKLDLSAEQRGTLELASSVYDIGRLAVPKKVLERSNSLTSDEIASIKKHPEAGEKILQAVDGLEEVLRIIRHHHERWDGTGYPKRLSGEETPYLARVLQVVDSFQVLTTSRPDRDAISPEEACDELRKSAGSKLDPDIVDALADALATVEIEQKMDLEKV